MQAAEYNRKLAEIDLKQAYRQLAFYLLVLSQLQRAGVAISQEELDKATLDVDLAKIAVERKELEMEWMKGPQ